MIALAHVLSANVAGVRRLQRGGTLLVKVRWRTEMSEPFTVVAALVGRPWDSNPEAVDEDCPTPYRDRIKVEFEASAKASLRHVLDEAATHFAEANPGDYSPAGRSLVFYGGDPDEGSSYSCLLPRL